MLGLDPEAFMGALPIALGLEGLADDAVEVTLAIIGEGPWTAPVRSWYEAQARAVNVLCFDEIEAEVPTFDQIVVVGTSLSSSCVGAIPDAVRAHADATFALVAAGVDADGLDPLRARLLELGGLGALSVEHIDRFGRVGREFVELVEHVHHVRGPTGQSRVADTLRAALFGRSGRVPVNLASREDPPALDPLTTMVFYVAVAEL